MQYPTVTEKQTSRDAVVHDTFIDGLHLAIVEGGGVRKPQAKGRAALSQTVRVGNKGELTPAAFASSYPGGLGASAMHEVSVRNDGPEALDPAA